MDFSKLVDWIKLSPKYLLPICLVSGFLLFANELLLEKFGLKESVSNVRPWIGIIFLTASLIIIVDVVYQIVAWIKSGYTNLRRMKNRLKRLKNLTIEEKDILDLLQKSV